MLNLSYGCDISTNSLIPANFTSPTYDHFPNVYITRGLTNPLGCSFVISVPVSRSLTASAITGNSSALNEAMKEGFQVKWTVSGIACEECNSNGSCGFDLLLNQTSCYCPDGQFSASCSSSSSPTYLAPNETSPSSGLYLHVFIALFAPYLHSFSVYENMKRSFISPEHLF